MHFSPASPKESTAAMHPIQKHQTQKQPGIVRPFLYIVCGQKVAPGKTRQGYYQCLQSTQRQWERRAPTRSPLDGTIASNPAFQHSHQRSQNAAVAGFIFQVYNQPGHCQSQHPHTGRHLCQPIQFLQSRPKFFHLSSTSIQLSWD